MREVIRIGDTLKVAVFHFLTRSYATRINVLSDSSDNSHLHLLCLKKKVGSFGFHAPETVMALPSNPDSSMTTLNFSPLSKALNSLDRALARALAAREDEELRDACIQRFEYSFELSWKMLKRQLREELANPAALDTWSYKQMIRVAGERRLITDVEAWFDYREKRNLSSHTYDERKANQVFAVLPRFAKSAADLLSRLLARHG